MAAVAAGSESAAPAGSPLPPDFVDVVGVQGVVDAIGQHQGERQQAEADDDGGEDERLWHRVRIGRRQLRRRPAGTTGGRARVSPPAVKMSRLVPLDRRPRPMISCASRRRSIR